MDLAACGLQHDGQGRPVPTADRGIGAECGPLVHLFPYHALHDHVALKADAQIDQRLRRPEHGGVAALHVDGSSPVQPPVLQDGLPGIRLPGLDLLFQHGHDVRVAVQDDRPPPAAALQDRYQVRAHLRFILRPQVHRSNPNPASFSRSQCWTSFSCPGPPSPVGLIERIPTYCFRKSIIPRRFSSMYAPMDRLISSAPSCYPAHPHSAGAMLQVTTAFCSPTLIRTCGTPSGIRIVSSS